MATIKLILRESKINKAGEAPIYLRVTNHRKSQYISLNLRVPPKSWNQDEQKIKSSYSNSTRLNAWLKKQVSDTINTFVDLHDKDANVRTKDIKETILGKSSPCFFEYANKYIERAYYTPKQQRTRQRYKTTINKLKKYLGDLQFTFDDLTVNFIKNYEHHLLTVVGNDTNTIHTDLKSVKRIINEAIEDEILPYEKNPFLRYKLKWKKTNKVYLTEQELMLFENYNASAGSMREVFQDAFVFACYAGGLRVSDVCRLQWVHFDGSHIRVTTIKTDDPVSIKLPKRGLEILEKYRIDNPKPLDYIFPIIEKDRTFKDYDELKRHINCKNVSANNNIQFIAKEIGLGKHISFHTSRHTFATRALSKGMKIHHVSKLLGHASVKTTEVYAKIVNKDLDDAMGVFDN